MDKSDHTILVIVGPFLAIFGPFGASFLTLLGPRSPQNDGGAGQNAPKTSVNHPKMRFGAILDHLKISFIHFEKSNFFVFYTILVIFGPFLGIFGPFWASFLTPLGPISPQNDGGVGQNAPKTGVNHPTMRFEAILDHLKVIFIHFGPF